MINPSQTQQSHLLEIMFERAPMGLAIFDQNKIVRRCNSAWGKAVQQYFPGASQPPQPGAHLLELLPDSHNRLLPLFEQAITGQHVEQEAFELENNGVVSYWDLAIAAFADTGEAIGLLCIMIDVTKRVLAQQELLAQEYDYQQVQQLAILGERDRLARSLHDRLAQALGYIKIKASLINQQLLANQGEQARASVQELKQVTDTTYADVREAIFNLRTKIFGGTGFVPTLKDYLIEYKAQYGIDTRLLVENDQITNISAEVGNQLIRIIQEALSNVRKHAQTRQVTIRFAGDADWLQVEIIDNGEGFKFDLPGKEDQLSFGLDIMQERAASVRGTFAITSAVGNGTIITICVPLK